MLSASLGVRRSRIHAFSSSRSLSIRVRSGVWRRMVERSKVCTMSPISSASIGRSAPSGPTSRPASRVPTGDARGRQRSTAGGAGVVEPRPRGPLGRLAGEPSPTGERTGPSPWPAPGGPPAIETGGRLFGAADLAGVLATRGRRRVRDGRPRDRPLRRPAARRERHDAVRRRRALAAARKAAGRARGLQPVRETAGTRHPASSRTHNCAGLGGGRCVGGCSEVMVS